MDPLIYVAAALFVIMAIILVTFLRKPQPGVREDVAVARPAPVRREELPGGVRRAGPRRRMHIRAPQLDNSASEDEIAGDPVDSFDSSGVPKKVGAKKLAKIQQKAEKRSQREAEEEQRREDQKRKELMEQQRKQDDIKAATEDKAREEEEARKREEQEKRDHEEYLKLKAAFTVEEEGTHEEELNQDSTSLLQEFIDYIKEMKVVMLEDLAAHFKIKTQDAIDRVSTLLEESRLSGVLDDRGKFIYITMDEYEAVAKFIKQRGRVSISELAKSSNLLINLSPENRDVHKKLVSSVQ